MPDSIAELMFTRNLITGSWSPPLMKMGATDGWLSIKGGLGRAAGNINGA